MLRSVIGLLGLQDLNQQGRGSLRTQFGGTLHVEGWGFTLASPASLPFPCPWLKNRGLKRQAASLAILSGVRDKSHRHFLTNNEHPQPPLLIDSD